MNPKFQIYPYMDPLLEKLEQVINGDLTRLMIFMPPRHGKSELISRMFSAYYLYRFPDRWVGLTSYAAQLAQGFSRAARENYRLSWAPPLSQTSYAVTEWSTGYSGGLWSSGVGGPITGRGFHLGVIDDPLKNAQEAASPTIRERQKEWWGSTFYTREAPNSAIVIVQTRWHEDDLSGWLLSEEEENPQNWHIIHLEGIRSDRNLEELYPVTCTVEPDLRKKGEALAPERYPADRLEKIYKTLGTYSAAALYDQVPGSASGNLFKRHNWGYWAPPRMVKDLPPIREQDDEGETHYCPLVPVPRCDKLIQSWDMTFKKTSESSFVVGQIWGLFQGQLFLLDEIRARMNFPETLDAVYELSDRWPQALTKLIEDKANGPAVISMLKGKIPGILAIEPEGSKEARAQAVAAIQEAHDVFIPHPHTHPWVREYVNELSAFPHGAHDDRVDATSQAWYRLLVKRRTRARTREY